MAGIIIVDQIQNSSNTGQLTFDNSGNFTTGNLICTGTITGGTGLLNIGSGQIYKDTSGNVGIGTSSPGSASGYTTLDVSNATNGARVRCLVGSTAYGGMYTNGTTDFRIGSLAAVPLNIITGSNSIATFDTSGNLGLGASPTSGAIGASSLQVGGVAYFGGHSYGATNNQTVVGNNCYVGTDTTFRYGAYNDVAAMYRISAGGIHQWMNAPSGTSGNTISWTQAMTLDASGRLLIGPTNAITGSKLHTTGGSIVNNNGSNVGLFTSDDNTVSLANGQSKVLISNTLGTCLVCIYETNSGYGAVFKASYGNVVLLSGNGFSWPTTDTSGACLLVSGHTLTFKNNTGAARTWAFSIFGSYVFA